jgi:hypothetical protein
VVASLVGLVALTIAAPATAAPTQQPPVTLSGSGYTASILQTQGFVTPKVFYRIGASQDVLVVYAGGGPADPLDAIRQIEGTVWGQERFSFDQLVIQNGDQAPVTISYADLQATLGPRPSGLGEQPLFLALLGRGNFFGVGDEFADSVELFKVIFAAIGVAALLGTLAFVLASFFGSRRRVPEESQDRLFA